MTRWRLEEVSDRVSLNEDLERDNEAKNGGTHDLDREFSQLRNAVAALRRIQEGSFGTCQQCDEDIHPKQLAAVPWTPFCIRCQEDFDGHPEEVEAPTRRLLAKAA